MRRLPVVTLRRTGPDTGRFSTGGESAGLERVGGRTMPTARVWGYAGQGSASATPHPAGARFRATLLARCRTRHRANRRVHQLSLFAIRV